MDIKGKCIAVLPLQTGISAKGEWKKMDFVIEYGEEYPKKACFTLFGDKVNQTPRVGDDLKVFYAIESKEYNGKYFTNLNCWKLEGFTGNLGQVTTHTAAQPTGSEKSFIPDDDQGLPF